ncbi:MAG: UDP-N-acetylmuramoyl-tripeptide--D-alanyl-D-alanine ligase [Betaproteobacteria bacterium]|jgi:UDP-N-acetylmuramoyl-tripeptide--D-alanyl-D-alanine ligase|nr:MAG: UDP-N-acetylmuramoyl-tripeptide--D-alanyl-D-alanine ligase [Betaproteobacteria bacterium]
MFKLSAAARAVDAKLHGADVQIMRVTTDSRDVRPGDLFIAITGPRFDGHDYVDQALARGAVAAMISDCNFAGRTDMPVMIVDDVRLSYGRLAAWWRSLFTIPLVAITGSNGKTTVKEMLAAILREQAGEDAVLATRGNLNNDIGVPTMLLELQPRHRFAVIEMGMNHLGEIAYLARIARPGVALVNNAGTAHIGEMGSVEAIARAKGEIFGGLDSSGVAIINADDAFADYWRSVAGDRKIVDFGLTRHAVVSARYELSGSGSLITLRTPDGEFPVTLQVPGLHNVKNALAAAATAFVLGVPSDKIAAGLCVYIGVAGRLNYRPLNSGDVVIDDSYNANPESARAALSVLSASRGQKILVLGDMGELGDNAASLHAELGGFARRAGVDRLLGLGKLSAEAVRTFGVGGRHFSDMAELLRALHSVLDGTTTVLVKGSRFMRMERVVKALIGDAVPASHGGEP